MKKIVAMGAAVALAASMFAAEPATNLNVAEFKGEASVKWGIDLDNSDTGFKNEESASIKIHVLDEGTKESSGSDVWGEIKIKAGGVDNAASGSATVEEAKIHFGDFFVGIRKGDILTGDFKLPAAIKSGKNGVDNVGPLAGLEPVEVTTTKTEYGWVDDDKDPSTPPEWKLIEKKTTTKVPFGAYTQGINLGYGNNNFGVVVDFRSLDLSEYSDKYGMSVEGELKDGNEWVNGLGIKAGYSFANKAVLDKYMMGYSANASYKATVSGDYYVKPSVGYVNSSIEDADTAKGNIAVGVLFGWGAEADADAGVYYLTGDDYKKVTPGVSVTYVKNLDDETTNTIEAAFFLGDLVENLKAAALADITTVKDSDTKIALRAGCAYDIKADDLTITTKGGILFANEAAGKDLEVSVGADLAGLINNTVFSVEYVSGNLSLDEATADKAKKGAVNLKCKMSI